MADRSGAGHGRPGKRKAPGEAEEQVEVDVVVHLHDGAPDGDRCGRHRYIDGARFACAGKIVPGKLFRGVDPREVTPQFGISVSGKGTVGLVR